MPISNIPILSMLRTRMEWHQERQRVLAENVANADTPGYRARDLVPPDFEQTLQATARLVRTDRRHIAGGGFGGASFADGHDVHHQTRPSGNAVSRENQMLKLAANQMDYEAATSVYTHSLSLIKMAFGK